MPMRTLSLEGGWIVMSHIGWEENKPPFISVWKPSPSRRILKSRGKVQTGKYLLTVNLGSYEECTSLSIKNSKEKINDHININNRDRIFKSLLEISL